MPMPNDPEIQQTAEGIVKGLHAGFGDHPGYRAVHAKGALLRGTFKPSSAAASLSKAYHFQQQVKVTGRFSNSGGLPKIPDTDPQGDPRGFAIRFHYPDKDGRRVHTDIIGHSVPKFPVRTGAEFLEFLGALGSGDPSSFLASHPSAAAFVQAPKPTPISFATDPYFGLSAVKLVDEQGKGTFVRYQLEPDAGRHFLSDEERKGKSDNFLFDELHERVSNTPIKFMLRAQVPQQGDVTDDITKQWPEDRELVDLGEITLDQLVPQDQQFPEQKYIMFDPEPKVEGIEKSDDPLFSIRSAVYLISGKDRRAADVTKPE